MVLSIQQAQELLKSPASKVSISEAQDHEERIKLHTKAVDKADKASSYFKSFLAWVKDEIKLPSDKFQAFKGMCKFPLPTTTLCTSIFDEYKKIFTAQDAYREYTLLDDTMRAEFTAYIESIGIQKYFQDQGLPDLSRSLNCIYVVDLPEVQTTARPQPYFYKVPISSVVDVQVTRTINNTYKIGYLAFQRGKLFTVIDEEKYLVFEKDRDGGSVVYFPEATYAEGSQFSLIAQAFHNLGEVPACFLSLPTLYDVEDGNTVARKSPISDHAGDLDWLLFYKIAERMYETYGPFPIITIPDTECAYEDAQGGHCEGGKIVKGGQVCGDCEICTKNSLVGPGTVFYRSVPKHSDDPKLDPASVIITPPDIPSLEYITKKIDSLEWNIYENAVGASDEEVSTEAVNEKQVERQVEGKRNVLNTVKQNFEHAEKFLTDIIGRFMYADYYVGSTINYGEQFLLLTASEITGQYKALKEVGMPNYIIAEKKEQLIQTEYKNNPYQKQRAQLMNLLEPWPDMSAKECMSYQLNLIFPEKFGLKLDFAKFISKFELANGDIVQWGTLLPLETKIDRLTEILTQYVTEYYSTAKPLPTNEGGLAGTV